jgi:ankyrin repeat protein
VVGLLLDAGALADTLHLARTPLEWARDGKNPDIIDVLTASSPGASELSDFDALLQAIDDGDHATVRTILESGQDPNEIDEQGNAPIHHAMRKRDDEALRLLLGSGADPDMRDAGDRHPAELAIGFDAGFDELLGASYELQQNRAAPLPEKDKVYEAGTVVGGPCMHTGQIPRDAGCGDSGTEVFIGTRYSSQSRCRRYLEHSRWPL